MMKIGQTIWKGRKVMEMDVDAMKGGMAILWQPKEVNLLEWRASHFSLIAEFQILGSEISGTIANIYGPSAFPQKQAFIQHLRWLCASAQEGHWIIGGYFILITSLREKKGGRRIFDKYPEEFQ